MVIGTIYEQPQQEQYISNSCALPIIDPNNDENIYYILDTPQLDYEYILPLSNDDLHRNDTTKVFSKICCCVLFSIFCLIITFLLIKLTFDL